MLQAKKRLCFKIGKETERSPRIDSYDPMLAQGVDFTPSRALPVACISADYAITILGWRIDLKIDPWQHSESDLKASFKSASIPDVARYASIVSRRERKTDIKRPVSSLSTILGDGGWSGPGFKYFHSLLDGEGGFNPRFNALSRIGNRFFRI